MDLITLIVIIAFISKLIKKSKETEGKASRKKSNTWEQVARQIKSGQNKNEQWYEMPKRNVRTAPAYEQLNMQQVHSSKAEEKNTTILQRAKANTSADKVDLTLQTMEAEHNHSERVAPAKHHHPEDIVPENMLGTVEDLMVKGYEGKLCFERDFVSEGMDMISRFTLGGI